MPKRILLCDDESHILRAAEFKLSRAGFEVRCAADGQQAWELIQQARPDLLVTDLQMPRLTGLELVGRLRADPATRDLPVLMLTAKGYEEVHTGAARQLDILRVLTKPFSPRELLQAVFETLEPTATVSAAIGVGSPRRTTAQSHSP
jgi:two-component system alkaline phosphatase synthesis response regulator PhoP